MRLLGWSLILREALREWVRREIIDFDPYEEAIAREEAAALERQFLESRNPIRDIPKPMVPAFKRRESR